MTMIVPPDTIREFADVRALVDGIAREYAAANAAVILDPDSRVLDLAVTAGVGKPAEPLIRWATQSPFDPGLPGAPVMPWWPGDGNGPGWQPDALLVLSVGAFDPDLIREGDLERYRRARRSAAMVGLRLLDWIETDGEGFRSYADLIEALPVWPDPPRPRSP